MLTMGTINDETSAHQPYLDVPLRTTFAEPLESIFDVSIYSADNVNERSTGRLLAPSVG